MGHLDGRPLDALTPAEQCLLDLMLTLAHVSLAVENQKDAEPRHARLQAHLTIERGTEDFDGTAPQPSGTR